MDYLKTAIVVDSLGNDDHLHLWKGYSRQRKNDAYGHDELHLRLVNLRWMECQPLLIHHWLPPGPQSGEVFLGLSIVTRHWRSLALCHSQTMGGRPPTSDAHLGSWEQMQSAVMETCSEETPWGYSG